MFRQYHVPIGRYTFVFNKIYAILFFPWILCMHVWGINKVYSHIVPKKATERLACFANSPFIIVQMLHLLFRFLFSLDLSMV